jgi:glycerol kinase
MSYVLSIDQGTSSSRVSIFNHDCSMVAFTQKEHAQIYPAVSCVEHNAIEIWHNVKACIEETMKQASLTSTDIVSIGITNQRETTVVWNKRTGLPYHNAIVWNDSRTAAICESIARIGGKDRFRPKTGLPLNPYFSASKLNYLLDTVSGLRDAAVAGEALFGTIDTWLVWQLTNGRVFSTDVSNASRTLLMNIYSLEWDDEILVRCMHTLLYSIL